MGPEEKAMDDGTTTPHDPRRHESVCPLWNATVRVLFQHEVLQKHLAAFFHCPPCDYVFAADPFWLAQAYRDAARVAVDTDVAVRNIFTALGLAALYYFALPGAAPGACLDAAGGYGLLTRLLRDLGFDCYWSDPYAPNLFARGFEYGTEHQRCTVVSAVEVVEHTPNPLQFVRDTLAASGASYMVFTTEVFPEGHPPAPDAWGYYSFDTGQHISFFSQEGLRRLGLRLGLHYYRLGRLHLYSREKLSDVRLRFASAKPLVVPLALIAARRLGSRRNRDQALLLARARQDPGSH
jgi:hypothetical protein